MGPGTAQERDEEVMNDLEKSLGFPHAVLQAWVRVYPVPCHGLESCPGPALGSEKRWVVGAPPKAFGTGALPPL